MGHRYYYILVENSQNNRIEAIGRQPIINGKNDYIELEEEIDFKTFSIRDYKIENGKLIYDPYIEPEELKKENLINTLRNERKSICFPIINRGKLWYDKLTTDQYTELQNWYLDWLNAPQTLIRPETPKWLEE